MTLIEGDDGVGYRRLTAQLNADGDVVFEGQDLGGAAQDFFGAAEYEYVVTVAADDVPDLVRALGGRSGDDVLDLIESRKSDVDLVAPLTFLSAVGVEFKFWSRRGD